MNQTSADGARVPALLACSAIYQSLILYETGAHRSARRKLADARQAHRQNPDRASVRAAQPSTTQAGPDKTGQHRLGAGHHRVTIGDVHEGIQAGQRSLESIKITEARYELDQLTKLGAALTGTSPQETRPTRKHPSHPPATAGPSWLPCVSFRLLGRPREPPVNRP